MSHVSRLINVAGRIGAAALVATGVLMLPSAGSASENGPLMQWTPDTSRITAVTVTSNVPVGTFNGAAYVRIVGTVAGVVGPDESIVGLDAVPKAADGNVPYTAQFEMITAAPGQPRSNGVVVEAENRGSPLVFDAVQNLGLITGPPATINYPAGLGNGFLQNNGLSWARVQWQGPNAATVVNATIPLTA